MATSVKKKKKILWRLDATVHYKSAVQNALECSKDVDAVSQDATWKLIPVPGGKDLKNTGRVVLSWNSLCAPFVLW